MQSFDVSLKPSTLYEVILHMAFFNDLIQLVPRVFAQDNITILPGELPSEANPAETLASRLRAGTIQLSDIPELIATFIQTGILLAGVVSFLMILVGGYQYIIGGVYSDMRENGKSTLIYAVSGFILSMLAYAIVTIVQLAATSLA